LSGDLSSSFDKENLYAHSKAVQLVLVHGVLAAPEVKKRPRKIVTVARTPKQSIPHLEQFEVEMIPGMKSGYSRFIYI
jgi:hypothetical protein